ncbi:YugN-like family protein [Bacillus sp. T33-2]|uniref:YugN-like family protein n=1 Tax=Bacillus sp. T33-2 TaxID=2054168 RepID=UPI000C77D953|nr:YugN-like family protein [Bacillus sp. T33-2]PLR96064.1 hypothetical protein CVD19_12180 [Bacillus sp. T33-2]
MIEIQSTIEGKQYALYKLKDILEELGYTIGGNWEYDHGYFDYKIDDEEGEQYLRLPFQAVDGQVDDEGSIVRVGRPFLLSHIYDTGIDEEGNVGNISASFNQFKEPANKDAEFPQKYLNLGKTQVEKLETALEGEGVA